MAFEQLNRDLRSAAHDSKRSKDHKTKWSRGIRYAPGVLVDVVTNEPVTGSDSQRAKVRPERAQHNYHVSTPNFVKGRSSTAWDMPPGQVRSKSSAKEELTDPAMSRSLIDMLPSPGVRRKETLSDNFLYNFERTDSPGKPLTLDVFVKENPKETEKFVEKEYEILDSNGDALKGRKARSNLRKGTSPVIEPEFVEDDGFELV